MDVQYDIITRQPFPKDSESSNASHSEPTVIAEVRRSISSREQSDFQFFRSSVKLF